MRVGIVGTGFAARLRAQALQADERCRLIGVAGHTLDRAAEFGEEFEAKVMPDWPTLLFSGDIDLVFISTINRDHGTITRQALEAGKHVVVEYPLALNLNEARTLVDLARAKQRLLHIEHIELLSNMHRLLQAEVPALGELFYAQYVTLSAAQPAPNRWTYCPELFGFPLVGAVSRLHRLIDLFGPVRQVSCHLRYDGPDCPERFASCLCTAHLDFASGATADLTYGKGQAIWRSRRTIEIHGQKGAILLGGEQDVVIRVDGARFVDVGPRRGLFHQDTQMVIEHLLSGTPLYITPERSLQPLEVAIAAERSAATHRAVTLPLPAEESN